MGSMDTWGYTLRPEQAGTGIDVRHHWRLPGWRWAAAVVASMSEIMIAAIISACLVGGSGRNEMRAEPYSVQGGHGG